MGDLRTHVSQPGQRSPHDLVLAAGGRESPFGDLGDGATAAGAGAGAGTEIQFANLFAWGWRARDRVPPKAIS